MNLVGDTLRYEDAFLPLDAPLPSRGRTIRLHVLLGGKV